MKYAIQQSRKGGYIPPFNKQYTKPEIRYYEASSEKEARNLNIKEHGFDWNYTTIHHVFEVGDYIGDYNDICYIIKDITDEYITIYNQITNKEYTEYVDYERWHLLRKHNHNDIKNYPIGSRWNCDKPGIFENNNIVVIADYALSYGTFWVYNENRNIYRFITRTENLTTIT